MNELDFDELDKAVSSLMSNNGMKKPDPVTSDDNEKTVDIESSSIDDNMFQDRINTEASKIINQDDSETSSNEATNNEDQSREVSDLNNKQPESSANSLISRRRRVGRFMDVVHPSSDMKKTFSPTNVSTPSRQGISVDRPTYSDIKSYPNPNKINDVGNKVVENKETPEISDIENDRAGEISPELETKKTNNIAEAILEDFEYLRNNQEAPSSPFLSDAKVEKRPLGIADFFSKKEEDVETIQEDRDDTVSEDYSAGNNQLPVITPESLPMKLPDEYHRELMEIESDTHMGVPKTDEIRSIEEAPVNEEIEMDEKPTEPVTRDIPQGPVSIARQYREEPSTETQENGTIYDTSAYHAPVAQPTRNKSGIFWVVGIIVILLLGAAGGAAVYLLDIV